MFCRKCGAEIEEGAKFCIRCGTPVAGDGAAGNPAANTAVKSGGEKKDNRKWFGIGAIALVCIAIWGLISLFKGSGGGLDSPEEAFDTYFEGFWGHDFDLMLSVSPDFEVKYEGGESAVRAQLQKNYDNQVRDYVSNGYRFTFKATGHTMLDKDEVKRVEKEMSEAYDARIKLSAAAIIDYNIIMKYEGTEKVSSLSSGYAVKYKGKWYYLNVADSSM